MSCKYLLLFDIIPDNKSGVPQGSILGLVLFGLYFKRDESIADLPMHDLQFYKTERK